jgi:hypothetical protein
MGVLTLSEREGVPGRSNIKIRTVIYRGLEFLVMWRFYNLDCDFVLLSWDICVCLLCYIMLKLKIDMKQFKCHSKLKQHLSECSGNIRLSSLFVEG